MANPEHVDVVRKGAMATAEWRRANPGARLDLANADLRRLDLSGGELSGALLVGANLSLTTLFEADLREADLTGARLYRAFLMHADLRQARVSAVVAVVANLLGANLRGANLSRAELDGANLAGAELTEADLNGASLSLANLSHASLAATNVANARLGTTYLCGVDLSQVIGLPTVIHGSPSSVDVYTLVASFRGAGDRLTPDLKAFFRGAGVPPELLEALPAIVAEVRYYSCFISYGQPDLQFAQKLRADLTVRGVSCWLYEMDKTVGDRTWEEIERKLEEYDRMVVVCSIDALMRDGVKKEIDKQIDKNPEKLMPVSLDSRWTQPGFKAEWGTRDLKAFLKERNFADFAGYNSHPGRYLKALDDLLKGLTRRAE